MGADANVFSQYLRPVRSIAEYRADAMDAQSKQQAIKQNALQLAAQQQAIDDDKATRDAYARAGGDQSKLLEILQQGGNYKSAQAIQKAQLDAQKTQSEVSKNNAEADSKKLADSIKAHDFALQKLQGVNDPVEAHLWAADNLKSGVISRDQYLQGLSNIPTDPEGFQAWKQKALQGGVTVLDNMKIAHEDMRNAATNQTSRLNNADTNATSIQNNAATNATSRANNAATNAVTMRGQNLTDARTREATAATMSKPFEVTGPDGNPMLVQQDKQGNIRPVQGFSPKGGEKPLTEVQGKAAGFANRARTASDILDSIGKDGAVQPGLIKRALESVPLVGDGLGTAANFTQSAPQQQVEQAQRDFVNAILRLESGAAISPTEFDSARKQYFPQPGDSQAVIAQKRQNRENAIKAMEVQSGPGMARINKMQQPQQPQAKTQSGATVSSW